MFFLGNPSGHDFEFHLNSWMEVLSQWKQGIIYPRWAAMAHYNYGEARFVFYPPSSWALGAMLGAVLPWSSVPGAFIWLALFAAGTSMFFLAREWLPRSDATFAAALYAVNPYHLVIVYWRSAFAELLASCLLPLLLLFVLRTEREGSKAILPLALIVAAAWLTNAPSAVMVNYSLALLIVISAIGQRSPRVLLYGAAAVAIGAALASFYLLPAAFEEKWVNIAEVLSPGVRPQDNFLFTTINDADHNRFNQLVSIVAVAEMIVLAGAAFLTTRLGRISRRVRWYLLIWGAASALVTFSVTFFFWEHLPKLRFVQLPWRWLLCMNVPLALFLAIGLRRWSARVLISLTMLAVVVVAGYKIQSPWWDSADDINEIRDNLQDGKGYEGTDEYVPAGADPYEIKQGAPQAQLENQNPSQVRVLEWRPDRKLITTIVSKPAQLGLRLFNYPAWRVTVNGSSVKAETHEVTGQMMIPLKPGENQVQVVFARTWDRTWGAVISALTLVLLVLLFIRDRRKPRVEIHR
jgi:6-pyruvoyl-tetrahydropterin synthase related domain